MRPIRRIAWKWSQNLQSGLRPKRDKEFNDLNILRILRIELLGQTQRWSPRGGFETISNSMDGGWGKGWTAGQLPLHPTAIFCKTRSVWQRGTAQKNTFTKEN